MNKVIEWLKWLLWDRWHGVSVGVYDDDRITQQHSPVVQIGRIRIPRWVLILALAAIVVVLCVIALRQLAGVNFISEKQVQQMSGATQQYEEISACILVEKTSGRSFFAFDCLIRQGAEWLWLQVPAILIFAAGVIIGWLLRSLKKDREE